MSERRTMGARRWIVASFALSLLLATGAACQAENSLVGAECAAGYQPCGDRCVDLQNDREHCGGCDVRCAADRSCRAGVCVGGGGAVDGEAPVDPFGDGGHGDGGDDGGSVDGSTDGSGGDADGGDGQAEPCPPPPYVTPAACGACGVVCVAPTSACLEDGAGAYACAPPCSAPTVACNGACVDLSNDPENCGVCGRFCPSNICVAGVCEGSTPGDVVAIGHDYRAAVSGTSQARVLTNAVFMAKGSPVRIVSYEKHANASAVARIKTILQGGGRAFNLTSTSDDAALASPTLVADYDAVLIPDQASADVATLTSLGNAWGANLLDFARSGGVVVMLDGGTGNMPVLTTASGLLTLSGHVPLAPGSYVTIAAPADRVATSVIGPYAPYANTTTFLPGEPESSTLVHVARQLSGGVAGRPVVIHKIVH